MRIAPRAPNSWEKQQIWLPAHISERSPARVSASPRKPCLAAAFPRQSPAAQLPRHAPQHASQILSFPRCLEICFPKPDACHGLTTVSFPAGHKGRQLGTNQLLGMSIQRYQPKSWSGSLLDHPCEFIFLLLSGEATIRVTSQTDPLEPSRGVSM